jgi:hypothetical protein
MLVSQAVGTPAMDLIAFGGCGAFRRERPVIEEPRQVDRRVRAELRQRGKETTQRDDQME